MRTRRRFVVSRPVRRAPDPAVQPSLLEPLRPVEDAGDLTIQERFERFHVLNPHIYRMLREMALELAAKGYRRIGTKMLWEVLRYQYAVATVGSEKQFKLNNIFPSRYARLLDQVPELHGRIELRELKAE